MSGLSEYVARLTVEDVATLFTLKFAHKWIASSGEGGL